MITRSFYFYNSHQIVSFTVDFDEENDAYKTLELDILRPFLIEDPKEKDQLAIEVLKKFDVDCKLYFDKLIEKYSTVLPRINGLREFFKSVELNHFFGMVPYHDLPQIENYKLSVRLKAINSKQDYEKLLGDFQTEYEPLIDNYKVKVFGDRRVSIGWEEKLKKCRFCGRGESPTVKFGNKSHAISEALGNKKITCLDECDDCNEFFSRELEPSIVSYLSFFRTIYGVKAKSGEKTIKSEDYKIERENGIINFNFQQALSTPNIFANPIMFKNLGKMYPDRVYKCLVKYFLSVVDKEQIRYFKKTIDWIRGQEKINVESLPLIGIKFNPDRIYLEPLISTFTKLNGQNELPFAFCELRFTVLTFLYIIPFSEPDKTKFSSELSPKDILESVYAFGNEDEWDFIDFSSKNLKNVDFKLNFKFE